MAEVLVSNLVKNFENDFNKILEIGSGTGFLTDEIYKKIKFNEITLNDLTDNFTNHSPNFYLKGEINMKTTLRILALTLCLIFAAAFMLACNKDAKNDTTTTTAPETTAALEVTLDEAQAKEIVWADLSIQESAAENLTVSLENGSYIIAFDWSGFDYQYTVNGATGEITEVLFDGSPLW